MDVDGLLLSRMNISGFANWGVVLGELNLAFLFAFLGDEILHINWCPLAATDLTDLFQVTPSAWNLFKDSKGQKEWCPFEVNTLLYSGKNFKVCARSCSWTTSVISTTTWLIASSSVKIPHFFHLVLNIRWFNTLGILAIWISYLCSAKRENWISNNF